MGKLDESVNYHEDSVLPQLLGSLSTKSIENFFPSLIKNGQWLQ